MNDYKFTPRTERILNIAHDIAYPNHIEPVHILLAACKEGTGVCGELYLYLSNKIGSTFIRDILESSTLGKAIESFTFKDSYKISMVSKQIVDKAHNKMCKYNQQFMNEGHLLSVILSECTIPLIDDEIKNNLLNIVAVPRDLIVSLNNFNDQELELGNRIEVRRAIASDYEELRQFVVREFGDRWLEAVDNGFNRETIIPIYISKLKGDIIGFAAFDVVENKKGLFGPMGTSRKHRVNGIGKILLHKSLKAMKQLGYKYAIIGQAGPIEFYEKTCNAKLIPIN